MFYSTDPTAQTASPPIPDDDRELQVLSIVHEAQAPERTDETAPAPTISQRSIAQALGMSVGLTNAILKRLTEKGFLIPGAYLPERTDDAADQYPQRPLPAWSQPSVAARPSILGHPLGCRPDPLVGAFAPARVCSRSRRSYLYLRRT
jgi:hypothetical protein